MVKSNPVGANCVRPRVAEVSDPYGLCITVAFVQNRTAHGRAMHAPTGCESILYCVKFCGTTQANSPSHACGVPAADGGGPLCRFATSPHTVGSYPLRGGGKRIVDYSVPYAPYLYIYIVYANATLFDDFRRKKSRKSFRQLRKSLRKSRKRVKNTRKMRAIHTISCGALCKRNNF